MPMIEPALLQLATTTVAEALKKGGSLSALVSDTKPGTIADAAELRALDPDQRAVAALGVAVAIVAILVGAGD